MPTFSFKAPNGKTVKVTGDVPPSEQELDAIFKDARVDIPDVGSKEDQKPSLGERAARTIEGSTGNRLRGFAGGAVKGAIEQLQHPFTFGGPQTQELIEKNVPGGEFATAALDVASPGAIATGAALGKGAQLVKGGIRMIPPGAITKGAEMIGKKAPSVGGLVGAYQGYKKGGVPGAIEGGMLGYGSGKLLGEALGGAPAVGGAPMPVASAAPKPRGVRPPSQAPRLILTPEEAAVETQQAKTTQMLASKRGMESAAYGKQGRPVPSDIRRISGVSQAEETGAGGHTGESAASPEAINRVGAMKAKNQQFAIRNRQGQIRKLANTVDAIDIQPGPGEIKGVIDDMGVFRPQ